MSPVLRQGVAKTPCRCRSASEFEHVWPSRPGARQLKTQTMQVGLQCVKVGLKSRADGAGVAIFAVDNIDFIDNINSFIHCGCK